MANAHKSVSEMLKGVGVDQKTRGEFEKELQDRQLVKILFALRNKAGVSQAEMAKKIGCSQSKISKIESSRDAELSFKDLLSYAEAIDHNIELQILPAKLKRVDRIKYHAFMIKRLFEEISEIAKGDADITRKAVDFHGETLVNMALMIIESLKSLKPQSEIEGLLSVSSEMDYAEILGDRTTANEGRVDACCSK